MGRNGKVIGHLRIPASASRRDTVDCIKYYLCVTPCISPAFLSDKNNFHYLFCCLVLGRRYFRSAINDEPIHGDLNMFTRRIVYRSGAKHLKSCLSYIGKILKVDKQN
jgi:hypothetical protein